jgi:NAD(P)-dependent dehydrogenase (short-subunit alcohol dehydrogenase family)
MTVSVDTSVPRPARTVLIAGAVHTGAVQAGAAHTGAAQAAGHALAAGFARRGWDVALAVDAGAAEAAAALAAELGAHGGRVAVLIADLAVEREARGLIPACAAALGRPACVVSLPTPPAPDRADDYAALLDATVRNVAAPLALARALRDATPEAARDDETLRAAVLFVLDQALFHPTSGPLPHALAQAALHRAIPAEALALAPQVRVAGLVRGRATAPDALADAACYLADAAGVTGATLDLDGGAQLAPSANGF